MDFKGHADQHFGHLTFSQHGEDLMIVNLFKLMGIDHPSYLDLGAHHPVNISNTHLLYTRGSSGVNVEANPNLFAEFMKQRDRDWNLNMGIGVEVGQMPFYMYDETSGLNSFKKEEVEKVAGIGNCKEIILDVVTVGWLIGEICEGVWPDFLNTDLEGLDYAVIESGTFLSSWPKIICTEVRRGEDAPIKELLKRRRYFCYCRTGENLIFVHQDYASLVY